MDAFNYQAHLNTELNTAFFDPFVHHEQQIHLQQAPAPQPNPTFRFEDLQSLVQTFDNAPKQFSQNQSSDSSGGESDMISDFLMSESSASEQPRSSSANSFLSEDDDDNWPEHILLMNTKDLNKYLKSNPELTEQQAASLKRARRRLKNRMYAKRSRDKRSLQDIKNGQMCMAQMRAKITRLQQECDRLRHSRDQLLDIVRRRCPDELADVEFLTG